MDNDRLNDFDEEERQLVIDFENTVLQGGSQFFDVDELEVIIDYYFEANEVDSLRQAVEYAEQLYPNSSSIRLRRGHLLIAERRFEEARIIIEKLRAEEPDNTDVAYSLGVVYGSLGESEKAIELFMEAANDGWMPGRVYANIAEEYYNLRDYDEAIRYYHLALDTDSYDNATFYNYLDTCLATGHAGDAVEYLTSFVGEHPYSCVAWHCLGTAYREMGLLEKAVDAYEYALAIDKSYVYVYGDLSAAYGAMGDLGNAVTSLRRSLDYVAKRSAVFCSIAYLYAQVENYEATETYLRKAIEEDPSDGEPLAALALALAKRGDIASAKPMVRKALRFSSNDPEVLCLAGLVYELAENYEQASDYFERMLEEEGCNESQCLRYAQYLFRIKDYDQLIDFLQESLEIYPHHPYYSSLMAAAAFYSNRYNRASRALPDADRELLAELCPEIIEHPRLGPLVPPEKEQPK